MENKKRILLSIHNIDGVAYKFNNKFKFLNLQHLVQVLDSMGERQLETCADRIEKVENMLSNISTILEDSNDATLNLIQSYDLRQYSHDLEDSNQTE
jgi:hypothetical protein